ncbi:MAG: ribosome maturation factor RimP [Spirochaetia bacterium]|nr:ribosome maturation factor RimP [Spirochaetia bacterium]
MSDLKPLLDKIREIIEPVIKDNFLELADIELSGPNYIRISIEKPGANISLDEVAGASRIIEAALDEKDIIPDKYFLEVSSPGINRPLKKKADYERFIGKKVRIVTGKKIDNTHDFYGFLTGVDGESAVLEINGKKTVIAFDLIKKANLDEDIF